MLIAVNHHYVRRQYDEPHAGIHGVTPSQLHGQLSLLGSAGEFVSADRVLAALEGRATLPERAIIVTFDDGLREQYEQALPVLRSLGVEAVCFINTAPIAHGTVSPVHKLHLTRAHTPPADFARLLQEHARRLGMSEKLCAPGPEAETQYPYDPPETARVKYALNFTLGPRDSEVLIARCFDDMFGGREREISAALYLSVEQVREMARLGFVGSHAHEHLPLGLLSRAAVRDSIARSARHLMDWTGRRPRALSYPYGSRAACASWVGRVAARAGFAFAFTMERAGNQDLRRPLQLARFDCNDLPGGKQPLYEVDELFERVQWATWNRRRGVRDARG